MKLKKDIYEKPGLNKKYLFAALLICIIGGTLALYATNLTIQLAKHEVAGNSNCVKYS